MPRLHPLVIMGALVPAVVALSMLAWLGIFSQSRALTPVEWIELHSATMRNGTTVSPAADAVSGRLFALLGAFLTGKGVIVKSRQGLTTFGEGLADDEIRYLHGVVERTLAGRT